MSPNVWGGGHVDFGTDPVGIDIGVGVDVDIDMTLYCLHYIL